MKIEEIQRVKPAILREYIQNFWANFRHHKRSVTLGCALGRIRDETLWKQWNHKSMLRYVSDELHIGQYKPYISAHTRLRALGVNSEEMERLEREHSAVRILKATKVSRDREKFFSLIQLRGEGFKHAIRMSTAERVHLWLDKKEYELLTTAARILSCSPRQTIFASAILAIATRIPSEKKRKNFITKRMKEFDLPHTDC